LHPGLLGEATLDDLYDPNLKGILLLQLALLSDALGLIAESAGWNRRAQQVSESIGTRNITGDFDWLGIAHAINSEDFELAAELALSAVQDRGPVDLGQLRSLRVPNPEEWAARKAKVQLSRGGDSRVMLIGMLPMAMHIARVYLTDPDRAKVLAQRAGTVCRTVRQNVSNREIWEKAVEVFDNFLTSPDLEELAILGNTLQSQENTGLASICYIGIAVRSSMLHSLYMQYAVMRFADSFHAKVFKGLYISGFVSFVEVFWQHAVENSGYQFSMPRYTLQRIRAALKLPTNERIRAVLQIATSDLNGKPSAETQAWLSTSERGV
jgi:hypothetical protein